MDTVEKPKRTRQMTEEQLEKLKLAREKALQKKRELKEIKDGEKAMKQQDFEERKKKVEEFKSRVLSLQDEGNKKSVSKGQGGGVLPTTVCEPLRDPYVESGSESEDEVVEEVIVKKKATPRKAKKKIARKIIEVSSSSSESDSSDDEVDYRRQL
jgi:polyhydroxyalkanoate synthesis regulator phasin